MDQKQVIHHEVESLRSELQQQKRLNAELQSELSAANELLGIRSEQIINAGNKALQQAIEIIPFKWNGYATLSDVISTLESLKSKDSCEQRNQL